VLEKMPPPEIKEEQRVLGRAATTGKDKKKALKNKTNTKVSKASESDMLLDLMGGSDVPAVDASATLNGQQQTADLLADILGGGSSVTSPPAQTKSPAPQSNADSIMDLFGNGAPKTSSPAPSGVQPHPAYNKNDLSVSIQISRAGNGAQALARFKNNSAFEQLTGVGLQAAVPKSQKLTLQGINKSTLEGGDEATQGMKIVAATGVSNCWRVNTGIILTIDTDVTSKTSSSIEGFIYKRWWCADHGPGGLDGTMNACNEPAPYIVKSPEHDAH
jgi:AP-1 complex subunit gamma-1